MRLLTGLLAIAASQSLLATALSVTLVTGTFLGVPHNFTGNGSGFRMGAFEVHNPHTAGLILFDITLEAVGSGDDSTAFSEIGLFIDTNGNGTFEPGVDSRYGQTFTAYPVDNGSLTFTESAAFAPGETKRFLIVGKMNGVVLPMFQHGFRTIVSSITATGGAATGVPTAFNEGFGIINYPTPLRLEYAVTGTAPPFTYTFRVILDNHDGSWSAGQSWQYLHFGMSAFGAPSGTAPFATWTTDAASFPVGPFTSNSWGVSTIAGIAYYRPGLVDTVAPEFEPWIPANIGDQLTWWGTCDVLLEDGEMAWSFYRVGGASVPGSAVLEPAYRVGNWLRVDAVAGGAVNAGPADVGTGHGFVAGAFTIKANGAAATVSAITLQAAGTLDDTAAFSSLRLFVDTNGNGAFDPGIDTQFGQAQAAFPADDGSLTFTGSYGFSGGETRRFLVVAALNGSATPGQTFQATVAAISATGGPHSGMPTAAMPGFVIVPAIAGGSPKGKDGGGCSVGQSHQACHWPPLIAAALAMLGATAFRARRWQG